ncbi:hypothetical protein KMP13_07400 [Epibacterium ulvae]|uniref:hypothetical protein n=1 Tax=Epibacterium ulvae TaxID=1156985 RepID=UPI001BFBFD7C|nr:hypothetical protein [Epibacterium ulvae]MBT8153724.1 hypothetical protein [Epibacterium ulvae]
MVEISEIKDTRSLEAWLQDKPSEFATVIAARSALRTLPLFWDWSLSDDARKSGFTALSVLKCIFAAAVVCRYPGISLKHIEIDVPVILTTRGKGINSAAWDAGHAVGSAVRLHAGQAANAAYDAVSAVFFSKFFTGEPGSGSTKARSLAAATIWGNVRSDCSALQRGIELLSSPLWHDENPSFADLWQDLRPKVLSAENWQPGDWRFWVEWYDQMLDPIANPPKWDLLEQVVTKISSEIWDAGPVYVSEAIVAIQNEWHVETNLDERIAAQSLMRAALSDFSFDSAARLMRMVPFPEDVRFIDDPDRLRSFLLDADDLRDEIEDYSAALKREGRAVQGAQFITSYLDKLLDEFSKARQTDQLNIGKIVRYGAFLDEARHSEETRKEFGSLLIKPLVNISDNLLDLTRRHLSETLMRFAPLDELTLEAGTTDWEYLNELRLVLTDLSKPSDRTPLDEKDQAVLNDLANAAERAMQAKSSITDGNALEGVSREVNFRLAQLTVTLALFGVRRQRADGRSLAGVERVIDWLVRVKDMKELLELVKTFPP